MAFDALEFVGGKSKTPLTSFKYANAPFFGAQTGAAFNPQSPEEYLKQKQNLLKKGYTPEDVNAAMQLFAPSTSSQTDEGRFLQGALPLLQKKLEQDIYMSSPEGMKIQLQMAREEAAEKGRQGLLFGTLAKLPEAMANAVNPFGGPVGAAMAYQGASAIPGIYAQTMASFPQIQVPGYSAQQYRYFQ